MTIYGVKNGNNKNKLISISKNKMNLSKNIHNKNWIEITIKLLFSDGYSENNLSENVSKRLMEIEILMQ